MAAVGVALAASGFVLDAPGVTWVRKVKPTRRYVQGRLDSLLWWRVYIGMVARTGQKLLKIGEVARLTGFSVKALHYYEERRLIAPAERSEAGHRLYGEEEVARLKFIKKAKLLGLTLKEIAELVELAAEGSRGRVIPRLEGILETHLAETERKMAELKMAELAEFREGLLYYRDRLFEADPAKGCGCGEGVSRSRPPRISAIFSSFTNVSMAAVMSTPKRIGHSAL